MDDFALRLRAFEKRCERTVFNCPVHLSIGQEAVPEFLHGFLDPGDWLFSTHRNHGHYLAKGGSEQNLWNEITGSPDGINGGFSGSQCFSDPSINFHASAIVGGLVGVAVGTALALQLSNSDAVVVCCIGDAACEQGVFWESLGFAVLKRLPIVFICENNGYSIHVPFEERQPATISGRVASFGIRMPVGLAELSRDSLPAFVEVACRRDCSHVGSMSDLR